ncbi:hypothetical protein VCR4J2_760034 [Vibrio coralliirubri]|nr:hypothetical protein VCR4J2_760034 [Vibrio coralliirubri]
MAFEVLYPIAPQDARQKAQDNHAVGDEECFAAQAKELAVGE